MLAARSTEALVRYIQRAAGDEALYRKHTAWRELPEEAWSAVRARAYTFWLLIACCVRASEQSSIDHGVTPAPHLSCGPPGRAGRSGRSCGGSRGSARTAA